MLLLVAAVIAPRISGAQNDHADHEPDDGPLHFSHPLFTESPSPDTKLRLDYIYTGVDQGLTENTLRVEGEYAFNPNVSIETNVPVTSRSANTVHTIAVGSGEIALKLASYAAAEHGLLLGGGVGFSLPTGSDSKGIGSGHLLEVEPYVDAGYMRGALELVTFLSFRTTTHRDAGEEREEAISVAASAIYHFNPQWESLIEVETRRAVAGADVGAQLANAGVGFKYHIERNPAIAIGLGGRIPITRDREFRRELIVSALYHF